MGDRSATRHNASHTLLMVINRSVPHTKRSAAWLLPSSCVTPIGKLPSTRCATPYGLRVQAHLALGPPWNIWADQGDTLMLRDFAWLQFYCETNQEVLDTTLLAFRLAEDKRE